MIKYDQTQSQTDILSEWKTKHQSWKAHGQWIPGLSSVGVPLPLSSYGFLVNLWAAVIQATACNGQKIFNMLILIIIYSKLCLYPNSISSLWVHVQQTLMTNAQTDKGPIVITIAYHKHNMLRWARNEDKWCLHVSYVPCILFNIHYPSRFCINSEKVSYWLLYYVNFFAGLF